MADQVVLILGGTSDIGLAVARKFAAHGYHIQLAARQSSRLDSEKSDMEIRYKVNVTLHDFDAELPETHAAFYGSLPVKPDVAVLAFGYLGNQHVAQTNFADAMRIMTVNYLGFASIAEILASDFEQRKSGTIIGIGSVAGDRGRASNYYYGSSKAAVTALLSGLRQRLFPAAVNVITVKPGFVRTKMTAHLPLPNFITAEPDQVAADILKAVIKRKNSIYSLWMWKWIMMIVRFIPETLFKRIPL